MQRSFAVDVLKIAAAQVIMLHHASAYGPLGPAFGPEWPRLVDFLFDYGRMAVQVFLVIGGFLAARSLERKTSVEPLRLIAQRYARLVPVYLVALAWVCAVVALCRGAVDADWLGDPPTAVQVLTHVLLLHGVLGQPSLSTGVWYVAVDLQLYAMLALMFFALAGGSRRPASPGLSACVLLTAASSLVAFSLVPGLDEWGIYFFGSYGLGVLAAWARRGRVDAVFFVAALAAAGVAMWVEPRERIALAAATALVLAAGADLDIRAPSWAGLRSRLSDSSYTLFLGHFGVIVLVSAGWNALGLAGGRAAVAALVVTWAGSVVLGLALHERVEAPLQRLLSRGARMASPS